jgi:hypothetical protein
MPTIFRVRGYRFFFFSREGNEPPHIHIEHAARHAKFWLDPVELSESKGFRSHELTELAHLVEAHKYEFKSKWDEHFGN